MYQRAESFRCELTDVGSGGWPSLTYVAAQNTLKLVDGQAAADVVARPFLRTLHVGESHADKVRPRSPATPLAAVIGPERTPAGSWATARCGGRGGAYRVQGLPLSTSPRGPVRELASASDRVARKRSDAGAEPKHKDQGDQQRDPKQCSTSMDRGSLIGVLCPRPSWEVHQP